MITPKVASLNVKGVLHWRLWIDRFILILFSVGDSGHTIRWCRETEFQQECTQSVYYHHSLCVCLSCVWAHTHDQITCYSQRAYFMAKLKGVIPSVVEKGWPLSSGLLIGITRLCRKAVMQSEPKPYPVQPTASVHSTPPWTWNKGRLTAAQHGLTLLSKENYSNHI